MASACVKCRQPARYCSVENSTLQYCSKLCQVTQHMDAVGTRAFYMRIGECINDDDPITLEPIAELEPSARFELQVKGKEGKTYCFDLDSLYTWIHSNNVYGDFKRPVNPLTREEISPEEMVQFQAAVDKRIQVLKAKLYDDDKRSEMVIDLLYNTYGVTIDLGNRQVVNSLRKTRTGRLAILKGIRAMDYGQVNDYFQYNDYIPEDLSLDWKNLQFLVATEDGYLNTFKVLLPLVDPTMKHNLPIQNAALYNHLEMVDILLRTPKVDPTLSLSVAVFQGHDSVVRLLLADGRADPALARSWTLRLAADNGHASIVAMLLKDSRVDPTAKDNRALRNAIENDHSAVFNLLTNDPRVTVDQAWIARTEAYLGKTSQLLERLKRRARSCPGCSVQGVVY